MEANMSRWFYRCTGCLSVVAAEESLPEVTCSVCGSRFESMGKVHSNRLIRDEERAICDDRCTNARGPSCDCKCGGDYHGSRMVVVIRHDLGPVPQLVVVEDRKARARVEELESLWAAFRAVWEPKRDHVTAQINAIPGNSYTGRQWLPRYLWDDNQAVWEAQREMNRCARLKSHPGRVKGMRAVIARLGGATQPVGQAEMFA
jgi:DNA-directed RNA polymerase subunit RPC12/RpoP